jgi:glycosyltransferase involved in cell wall biosynthesis
VEIFAGVTGSGLVPYAQRRSELVEPVTGQAFGVTVVELEDRPDQARAAEAFASFLERERPQVCHFESLDPMGVGLVREAKVRRISTLYSAQDTWPAHDRVTLTMPDMSPFELGDTEAEARSLAAERLLAASGLRPGDPTYDERAKHFLHQELTLPEEASVLRDAREAVEMRRAEKRVALSGVDRRFAASRLLSRELSAAVGRAFTFRAPGVDRAVLAACFAGPVAEDAKPEFVGDGYTPSDFSGATFSEDRSGVGSLERAKGPIRLVYMGTTERTSGLDVLLDAVARIRAKEEGPAMSLRLALERTEDVRDAEIHARAQQLRVDVVWSRGSSVDATAALVGADLLVMPSLWGEVAPSALRIAFAAGIPVVASRMPGVIEAAPSTASVLVTPGSVDSLTEALSRLAGEGGAAALRSMRSAALSEQEVNTKSVDDEALEWLDTYQALCDAAAAMERARKLRSTAPTAPMSEVDSVARQEPFGGPKKPERKRLASLVEVEEQIAEMRSLSNTELFARAQAGISKLRQAFGLQDSDAELLARVVARGGSMRDRAEHDEATRKEVARALHDLRVAQSALEAEESVRSRRILDLHSVLEQFEHEVALRAEEAAQAVATADEAKAEVATATSAMEEAQARMQDAEALGAAARDDAQAKVRDAEASKAAVKSEAEAQIAGAGEEAQALRGQVEGLKKDLGTAEEAAKAMSMAKAMAVEEAAEAGKRYREVTMQVEAAKKALNDVETARDELARSIDERSSEIRAVRERMIKADGTEADASESGPMGDLESIEAYCVSLERDLEALQRNDSWVAGEADRLINTLSEASEDETSGARGGGGSERAAELQRLTTRLERMTVELDWRRVEMEGVARAAESKRMRFLAGPLASRLRSWGQPPQDVVTSMSALAEVSSRSSDIGGGEPDAMDDGLDQAADKGMLDPFRVEDAGALLPTRGVAGDSAGPSDETVSESDSNEVSADSAGQTKSEVKS